MFVKIKLNYIPYKTNIFQFLEFFVCKCSITILGFMIILQQPKFFAGIFIGGILCAIHCAQISKQYWPFHLLFVYCSFCLSFSAFSFFLFSCNAFIAIHCCSFLTTTTWWWWLQHVKTITNDLWQTIIQTKVKNKEQIIQIVTPKQRWCQRQRVWPKEKKQQ